jgi:hypothetical protein
MHEDKRKDEDAWPKGRQPNEAADRLAHQLGKRRNIRGVMRKFLKASAGGRWQFGRVQPFRCGNLRRLPPNVACASTFANYPEQEWLAAKV